MINLFDPSPLEGQLTLAIDIYDEEILELPWAQPS